jgi:Tfp pilus assembly protein PilV
MVKRRGPRGFTLVEVMMAMLIAMVGLLGLLAITLVMGRGSMYTRNLSEASLLVQTKIEEIQSQANVTVAPATPPNGATVEVLDNLGRVVSGGQFTRTTTWSVSTDGLRRVIDVTVSFQDASGTTRSVMASTERIP